MVEIAWDANLTDADLAGYTAYAHTDPNIYLGTPAAAKAVARTVTVGSSVTDQIFSNLDVTRTWFFAVTAFDASGNESAFSTVVSALPSIAPTIRTVSPNTAEQGTTGLAVTVAGGNFQVGCTVDLGPGISVTSLNASGAPATLVATVTVDPLAQVSTRSVVVTNPGGASGTRPSAFTVTIDVARLDSDASNRIDNADFVNILLGFPSTLGDSHYNTNRDLDVDGKVDGADLAIFFTYFGQVGPFP